MNLGIPAEGRAFVTRSVMGYAQMLELAAAALVLVVFALATARSHAQAPLPGERPLDALRFKGSHNSYERSEPNDRQVAEFNCWAIEFDLNWDGCDVCGDGAFTRDIWVAHGCPIVGTTTNLRTELRNAMSAPHFTNRITIFNLEMKDNSACPHWGPWPPISGDPVNSVDLVRERVQLALGDVGLAFGNVYTPAEFVNEDSRWPSWQELVRRRKYLIIVLQTGGLSLNGANVNPWFFNALSNPDTWNAAQYNYAFVNRERGSTNGISISPFAIDRWMWRSWPTSAGGDNWQTAVDRGFNEIASNNINQDYTNDGADVHSSQPLFVNWASGLTEWGTCYRPYNTFTKAYNRASPAVDVYFSRGSYDEQITLAKPMRLHALDGLVRIGAP